MAAFAQTHWLTQVLRLMPTRLHAALDAWSYRVAQKRAQQRRQAVQPTVPQTQTAYKIRPWRD